MTGQVLPLWNKDETDVLPQFQLSYGHVLCDQPLSKPSVVSLARYLGIGDVQRVGEFDIARLPRYAGGPIPTLGGLGNAHLLAVSLGPYTAIFAPHVSFFNNQGWINWSKKSTDLLAIVTRHSILETSYRVFRRGQRTLNAWAEGDQLRFPNDPVVQAYVNGELVFQTDEPKRRLTADTVAMLTKDVEIVQEGEELRIREKFSDNLLEVAQVTHFIFRK